MMYVLVTENHQEKKKNSIQASKENPMGNHVVTDRSNWRKHA